MSNSNLKEEYGRIDDIADIKNWSDKKLTIIGMGSMGQPISEQLARHGVASDSEGEFRLYDGDIVSRRNLIGTGYTQNHINQTKGKAASEIIHRINPEINVSYFDKMLAEANIPEIIKAAESTDLLCLFADSFKLMLDISDECYNICPQVMAIFGANADYAEVAFSIPQKTCKISQALGKRKRKTISKPTAFGCDTTYITSFVTSLCLSILSRPHVNPYLVPCHEEASLYLVGLRNTWIFEKQPRDILRSVICIKTIV